ncbi:MAG: hypothetical protein E6J41_10960, partial [Chloroflexi bacterium]
MIGHRLYAPLLEEVAKAGATLVQVGDEKQLSPIEAGGLWTVIHGMAEEKGLAAELREIRRARNPEEAQAWIDFRAGRVAEALTWYRDEGLIRLYDTRPELLQGMLEEWWAEGPERGVMVVDSTNEERDELNAMAQARRLEVGELGADALRLETGREIRAGDRVLFDDIYYPGPGAPPKTSQPATFSGARASRVENGTRATVLSVDLEVGTAVVQLHEPKPKGRRGSRSQAAMPIPEDRVLTVPASVPLQLGYARHVYKAQGMTVEVANVATGPRTPHNQLYVMISRSRDGSRIHTVRAEVEAMGADPDVLDQPAAPPRGVSDDDLMAELLARREAELGELPLWEQRAGQERDDHLFPAERRQLDVDQVEELPPGAVPLSEFLAQLGGQRERVAVPVEAPGVWEATRDRTVRHAGRSTTKKAIGRPMWSPTAEEDDRQDQAAEIRDDHWEDRRPQRAEDHEGQTAIAPPARSDGQAGEQAVRREREPRPAPLPGRDPLDTAARDHARWCDAPKVLASYEVAGRLDIAADPIEQAARRWLADPAAAIVVADQDQEQLVRSAVARLLRSSRAERLDQPRVATCDCRADRRRRRPSAGGRGGIRAAPRRSAAATYPSGRAPRVRGTGGVPGARGAATRRGVRERSPVDRARRRAARLRRRAGRAGKWMVVPRHDSGALGRREHAPHQPSAGPGDREGHRSRGGRHSPQPGRGTTGGRDQAGGRSRGAAFSQPPPGSRRGAECRTGPRTRDGSVTRAAGIRSNTYETLFGLLPVR